MEPLTTASIMGGVQAFQSGLGMIGAKRRDKRAQRYNKELMGIQFKNQMELNKQGQELQLDTWKKTSYPAQMEMLKEAGLNPALIYGQGGQGGTTGSQSGGSASGGSADVSNYIPQFMDVAQTMKLKAELDLMKAQANKTEAEAENLRGGQRDVLEGTVKLISAQTDNTNAQTELYKVDTAMKSILKDIQEDTKEIQIESISNQVKIQIAEIKRIGLANKLSEGTIDLQIESLRQNIIGQKLNNILTSANIDLTKQKTQESITNLAQGWAKLNIDNRNARTNEINSLIHKFEAEIKAEYPNALNVVGSLIDKVKRSAEKFDNYLGFETYEDRKP